jgi:TonB family protein
VLKCPIVFADLYSATVAYQNKNYKTAFHAFEQLAQLGNSDAMYNLAVMSLHGQGTAISKPKAYAWFMLAGEFGSDDAQQTAQLVLQSYEDKQAMFDMYQTMQKIYSHDVTAKLLYPSGHNKRAHSQTLDRISYTAPTYPDEARRLGLEGWVWAEFDIDDSGKVTNISIVDSHPKNTFTVSIINALHHWRYATSVPINNRSLTYHFTTFKGQQYEKSFHSQKLKYQREISQHIDAAEQGNGRVQYYISQWLNSDKYNASKLLKYHFREDSADSALLMASAKNNYPLAQYKLATSLLNQNNSTADQKIGLNWLQKAASQNLAAAQYRLGLSYLKSTAQHYAPNQGIKWLTRAADLQHFRAIIALTGALINTKATPDKIMPWLKKGLSEDSTHPTLLLYKSKLVKVPSEAKALAEKARKSAISRGWSTTSIDVFIASLN